MEPNYKEPRWDELKALASDREANFEGRVLASAECEPAPLCFDWLVAEHPGAFLRLIAKLVPREREALILHYMLGHSHGQMAKVLGMQASGVTRLVRRAVARLYSVQSRCRPYSRILERRTDPDVLGNFRVPMADAPTVFSFILSHIRVETSPAEIVE